MKNGFIHLLSLEKKALDYFIFILLIGSCIFFIPKINFVKSSGIKPFTIRILFILKVLAGLTIGWLSFHFYKANDYWDLNKEGILEYKLLLRNPKEFISNIAYSPYQNKYGHFFNAVGSYWNDLRNNIIIKILAICNLISHGNFYINALIFNIFGFLGCVALYKVFIKAFPNKHWQTIVCAFLIPTTLYFTSGIHKDLIIFTSLSFYIYYLFELVNEEFKLKILIKFIIALIIILLVRNFILIPLIPFSLLYLVSRRLDFNPIKLFFSFIAVGLVLLVGLDLFSNLDFPFDLLVQRQADFLNLEPGQSQFDMTPLLPTLKSIVMNLPNAFEHVFLRPYIWEDGALFYIPAAIELLFFQGLLILFLFFREKNDDYDWALIWLFVCFSLFMFIIIGLIIPNLGAVVRYKSIYLPFILLPLICSIRWDKLIRLKRMMI